MRCEHRSNLLQEEEEEEKRHEAAALSEVHLLLTALERNWLPGCLWRSDHAAWPPLQPNYSEPSGLQKAATASPCSRRSEAGREVSEADWFIMALRVRVSEWVKPVRPGPRPPESKAIQKLARRKKETAAISAAGCRGKKRKLFRRKSERNYRGGSAEICCYRQWVAGSELQYLPVPAICGRADVLALSPHSVPTLLTFIPPMLFC